VCHRGGTLWAGICQARQCGLTIGTERPPRADTRTA
jgi:hypothetical protein